MPPIPLLTSVEELANSSEAWISDIWGVLHNGIAAFPEAGRACVRFRERGGTIVLVTNAPRPAAKVARLLERMGLPREGWDAIITSGDVSCGVLREQAGRRLFHLGPERDVALLKDLPLPMASAGEAEIVLCTGLVDDEREKPEDYRDQLARWARRDVTLVCANPDLMVERGERLVPCAGSLALIYEELGGKVIYAGKPHAAIYARAYEAIAAA
ncbi:MAG: TIGR01459 family HAD-type hydrolase, partial [Proteobacteria bacterium]|nr:TIGR01459 family HAD-type hydrolase [Pseudomonadota bacterium]